VVYDGFCGTGMTGVAALMCGNPSEVASLELSVKKDGTVTDSNSSVISQLGVRRAILNDLSPTATFIAYNYTSHISAPTFGRNARRLMESASEAIGWMYQTLHKAPDSVVGDLATSLRLATSLTAAKDIVLSHKQSDFGRISYTVWSEVFTCNSCSHELIFLREALDSETGGVRREFNCSHCQAVVSKRSMQRVFETRYDATTNSASRRVKRVPVFLVYVVKGKKYTKEPDAADLALIRLLEEHAPEHPFPDSDVPRMQVTHVKDKMSNFGITSMSHFFQHRAQHALSTLWSIANRERDERQRHGLIFMIEQCIVGMTVMNRYSPTHFSQVNRYMSGVFYVPSQCSEVSPWYILSGKARRLEQVFASLPQIDAVRVSLGSCGSIILPADSVDYIFTDPPFGENLQYSELNWFNEMFYGVLPDTSTEAVVNQAQNKSTETYMRLMLDSFRENYRLLKPGRWMTVEFHNSQNSIWNAIHEAIIRSGFVIADVRTLDKQGETYKQSLQGTVKADLVISCYKPSFEFEERFKSVIRQTDGVVEFLRGHLEMLPVAPIGKEGRLEAIAERMRVMLFNRMVAYHLQKGAKVPVSSGEFYKLLEDTFFERDGMYFLADQVTHYDAVRAKGVDLEQLSIFVQDERSAIQWIRNELSNKPQRLGELTPKFMQASKELGKHEALPELRDLLQQYFIRTEDETWVVPNPDNEKHIEEIRLKALLREFQEYVRRSGQLKAFRTEALLAGFAHCWGSMQYDVIVGVCEKIPPKVLQEIQDLVMFYDIAKERAPDKVTQFEFKWE
jgi:predicted RNA methylase